MLIVGEWQVGDDRMTRPVVRAHILGLDGNPVAERFLVDSGADRTVLSATILEQLHLPVRRGQPGLALSGIGGESAFVLVSTVIVFGSRGWRGGSYPRRSSGIYRLNSDGPEHSGPRCARSFRCCIESTPQRSLLACSKSSLSY